MAVVNDVKPRRPRRSKADIEEAIQKAATAQIKKKGFSLALVTDIVKRAKIEPIVFYNRYKNLDEFYDGFVKQYDYWLSDLIRSNAADPSTEEGLASLLEALFEKLLSDKIMTELLRWEITEGNHITERTARLRELHSMKLINHFNDMFRDGDIDMVATSTLIVAGLYYMVLHKDRSTFGGIDINSPEGRGRIHAACRSVSSLFFRRNECDSRIDRIAERMRAEGIDEESIARCINAG